MSLDEKDDVVQNGTKILIQSQSVLFHTTYETVKKIPFLESLYMRWSELNKGEPLVVDLPARDIRKALNYVSEVEFDYFGIQDDEKKVIKDPLFVDKRKYDGTDIHIEVGTDYVRFRYHGKNQTWRVLDTTQPARFNFSNKHKKIGTYFEDMKHETLKSWFIKYGIGYMYQFNGAIDD